MATDNRRLFFDQTLSVVNVYTNFHGEGGCLQDTPFSRATPLTYLRARRLCLARGGTYASVSLAPINFPPRLSTFRLVCVPTLHVSETAISSRFLSYSLVSVHFFVLKPLCRAYQLDQHFSAFLSRYVFTSFRVSSYSFANI